MSAEPEEPEATEQPAPYVIEGARSSRSRCKRCRRPIQQGTLRIGMSVEGPYGQGYLWFHLPCAARGQMERVEEAYAQEAWKAAKVPPAQVPSLEELRAHVERAEQQKKEQRALPYVERAPSGRSKCKHCNEPIAAGSLRVALARSVTFGRQVRTTVILVHPRCVAAELLAEDCATEIDGFAEGLHANSRGLERADVDAVLAEIGPLDAAG
jgi:hypothetical protein